ncbi:hypothetical protein [Aureispira sp. CCB-E]|uniref:hypothetical protein n=1 Tax=Aureispira sp. CCB-E TaxID=3051121 RepID=UPI00286952F0|nr:hypothetical protein [Aureispira sp. CCB-E]WMX14914.1 hypothetical protein QP953_00855 [Aureispira sp. CCB-E]
MPKYHTFPTLYNEVLQLSTTKLKEWEYLKPNSYKSGILTWSSNGKQIGRISILIDTSEKQPYIELDYKFRDKPRNYKIKLVSMPSNLGKGVLWSSFVLLLKSVVESFILLMDIFYTEKLLKVVCMNHKLIASIIEALIKYLRVICYMNKFIVNISRSFIKENQLNAMLRF